METPVLLAIVAATVSVVGWVTNYILSGRDERRKKQLDASLGYLESQLQDLYGPLSFSIQESRRTHNELMSTLGRSHLFHGERELTPEELKIWLFWVENDILPRNERIKELMTGKTHLIQGGEVPQSFLDFMEHHNSWKMNHLRWQKENVPYSWHSNSPFPDRLEPDVLETFAALKQKHTQMLGERHVSDDSLIPVQKQPPTQASK